LLVGLAFAATDHEATKRGCSLDPAQLRYVVNALNAFPRIGKPEEQVSVEEDAQRHGGCA
jgi:hypothetical protein